MESTDKYFERKFEELNLLNSCLTAPLLVDRPNSITEVIRKKFELTAALRADHELQEWNATETAWAIVQPAAPSSSGTTINARTLPWRDRHSMSSMRSSFGNRFIRRPAWPRLLRFCLHTANRSEARRSLH